MLFWNFRFWCRVTKTVVMSAWRTTLWSSTTSLDLGFEKKKFRVLLFSLVWHCWAVGVSRLWEKEQNSVLCISSLPLTPTQQTWSPTGRLGCESSSSLLTIVLFFLSPSVSFFVAVLLLFLPTVILEKPIRIPRSLSVKAASVLKGFLNKVRAVYSQQALSRSLSMCTAAHWNHQVWDHGQELGLSYKQPGKASVFGSGWFLRYNKVKLQWYSHFCSKIELGYSTSEI